MRQIAPTHPLSRPAEPFGLPATRACLSDRLPFSCITLRDGAFAGDLWCGVDRAPEGGRRRSRALSSRASRADCSTPRRIWRGRRSQVLSQTTMIAVPPARAFAQGAPLSGSGVKPSGGPPPRWSWQAAGSSGGGAIVADTAAPAALAHARCGACVGGLLWLLFSGRRARVWRSLADRRAPSPSPAPGACTRTGRDLWGAGCRARRPDPCAERALVLCASAGRKSCVGGAVSSQDAILRAV